MNERVKSPKARIVVALLAALLASGCGERAQPPLDGARIGGPFALTAHDGRTLRDQDFKGRYRLIYFGYSYCPDVCPVDLLTIGQGLSQFEKADPKRGAEVQPLFISVDPDRDTPSTLDKYVGAFHPRLIGLTGTPQEIAAVTKRYGIVYSKRETEGASEYLMDHSRQAMLFGPEGQPIALIPQDEGAKAVAAELDRWVR